MKAKACVCYHTTISQHVIGPDQAENQRNLHPSHQLVLKGGTGPPNQQSLGVAA